MAIFTPNKISRLETKSPNRIRSPSTIQHRASVHPENAKTFNHGKGFVIGHQWTNIVLLLHDSLIPLPPIPFYSKRYCQKNNMQYQTEHELVIIRRFLSGGWLLAIVH